MKALSAKTEDHGKHHIEDREFTGQVLKIENIHLVLLLCHCLHRAQARVRESEATEAIPV